MTPDLRWYAARAGAMSPAEVAWRLGSAVRTRLPDVGGASHPPGRFDDPDWRAFLLELCEIEQEPATAAAARIAAGELSFWGRSVELDTAAPDWSVDPLTGQRWLEGAWRGSGRDPKPVWELHRQQHLVPLAAGAALAGRADWGRLVVRGALDWVERNPQGSGLAWSSGYEAAHRLVSWAFSLPLACETADASELELLGAAVAEHRAFVAARPSRFSSANNHRLAELAGLLAGSHLTPGRPGWAELWQELEEETERQTYADGGSREQAGGYFLYVLEILWVCALLARGAGQGLGRIENRLRAMLDWLAAVAGEDGEPPPVGDDAEDRMLRLDYFGPRRAATIGGRAAALLGGPAPLPRRESVVLAESGYAVLRSGPARVVFDIGELGLGKLAAHGHADALSVLVDRGGDSLLRDTGTGSYVHGREDDRATAFHNTVVVDGRSQAEHLGPHLWGRRVSVRLEAQTLERELDYVRASHDGYGHAVHTRSVSRIGTVLLVLDRVAAAQPVTADLIWQPGPALREGASVVTDPPVAREELPGAFSPRYTWTEPARRLVWAVRGTDVVFASAVPLDGAQLPELRLQRSGESLVVEVAGRRVVEDWRSPVAKVTP